MSVHEDDLVLVDRYAMLYVPRKLLVQDHKHNNFEALRGEVHQIRDGFALELV